MANSNPPPHDATTTLADVKAVMETFVAERNWEKFHLPKNLAISIAIEAAELMELFQWDGVRTSEAVQQNPEQMQRIREELSDVFAYTLAMANRLNIDLALAFAAKMEMNREKYPAGEEQF
ncbi:MAG: nucleotide pyrophosphohydrolase [Planctomycetota bacterium]